MNDKTFSSAESFLTLQAFEIFDVTMRFQMRGEMTFWVHSEATNSTLKPLDPKMDNVQVVDDMRFMGEPKEKDDNLE